MGMEMTTRMLADAAQQGADGKVHILGGQWDRIMASSFPTTHPTMALVLVFEIEYGEALDAHALEVTLMKDGEPKGVSANGQINVGYPPGLPAGASQYAALALTFPLVTFEAPGRYEWAVTVDGQPHGSVPLELMTASPSQ